MKKLNPFSATATEMPMVYFKIIFNNRKDWKDILISDYTVSTHIICELNSK